ncbi:MAG: hypothetical protein HYW97_01310 [Candidatus Wildermuthbacteria bacterium]|nr:hypothetical protein [Candidatus Wildermuthbacteria bacterium]
MVSVREPFATLQSLGMVHRGHFVYASGQHGEWFVSIAKGEYDASPELLQLCSLIAEFSQDTIQVVVGAATGGTTIGRLVATRLSELLARQIPFVLLEKIEEHGILGITQEQGKLLQGKQALVEDDVLNSGQTIRRIVKLVEWAKGNVAGVSVVWNRGGLRAQDLLVPWLYAPITHQLPSYPVSECSLCAKGIPVNTDMGHGKEFLAQQAAG